MDTWCHLESKLELGGKPSITRLNEEHSCAVSPDVLHRLKSFSSQEMGRHPLLTSGNFFIYPLCPCGLGACQAESYFFRNSGGGMVKAAPFFGITEPTDRQKAADEAGFYSQTTVLRFEPLFSVESPRIAVAVPNQLHPCTRKFTKAEKELLTTC